MVVQLLDSNAKIPVTINKTTYYKVVDKNNPTFNANKTDKTVQDYKENGNEVELASYTLKAEEGQRFTASGERQFDGYKLYQAADANDQSGTVSRPYTVGTEIHGCGSLRYQTYQRSCWRRWFSRYSCLLARSKTTKQTF